MSKFIVVNVRNSVVSSTHSTQILAEKAAIKLHGCGRIIETSKSVVKKGDLWMDLDGHVAQMEAEQELAECDEAASHNLMAYGTVDCCYPEPVSSDSLESVMIELLNAKARNEGKKVFADFDVSGVFNSGVRQSATVGYSICDGVLNANETWSFRVKEDYHHPHATYQGRGIDNLILQINERTQKPSTVHFYITVNETAIKTMNYLSVAEKETDIQQQSVTYIAKPSDNRCSWWCVQVPENQELDGKRINAPYLRNGEDLELRIGDMLIDSEAFHHRKQRGFDVVLKAFDSEKPQLLHATATRKAFIKAHGGQDLMRESGDVNGCIRMAVWLRRQPDFKNAVAQLLECR